MLLRHLTDTVAMSGEMAGVEGSGIKRQQRRIFLVGFVVAAVPIVCQFLMLGALKAAPDAFPAADRTFTEARFWPIQVVLLCVAVAGSAIVNCVRLMLTQGRIDETVLAYFLPLLFAFFVESMIFSVTLLAAGIGWGWLSPVARYRRRRCSPRMVSRTGWSTPLSGSTAS
jgi:hypothetical protein